MIKSKKHKLLFCFLCILGYLCIPNKIYAKIDVESSTMHNVEQQNEFVVKGTVKDATGEPLTGVSISVKGESIGTVTNIDGEYSLKLSESGKTLNFSYVGFKPLSMKADKATLNVVMHEDTHMMGEVVVVGYGVQKKENLTGAVSTVNLKDLDSRPIPDIARGLQGTTPGVTITVPTGEVGSDPVIKIRGNVASQHGNSQPLILLDNVEIPSLQVVNSDDIESISFLKDAASTSIYGSKGAFGVMLITSKKGSKSDKISVSYSGNISWQNPWKKIEMAGLDGVEYALRSLDNRQTVGSIGSLFRADWESLAKAREWQATNGSSVKWNDPMLYGRDWIYRTGPGSATSYKFGYRTYDIQKAMINEWAPTQQHNVSINGKSGNTTYNVGLGYLKQSGMIKPAVHDDFTKYNASMSFSNEVNKYVTFRVGAIYSDRNKRYPGVGVNSNPWVYLYRYNALAPVGVTDYDGRPIYNSPSALMSEANTDNQQYKYFNINLGATINFTSKWDLKFDYTYDRNAFEVNSSIRSFNSANVTVAPSLMTDAAGYQVYVNDQGQIVDTGGMPAYRLQDGLNYTGGYGSSSSSMSVLNKNTEKNTFNAFSTYNLELDDQNRFTFMLGTNVVTSSWTSTTSSGNDLIQEDNPQWNLISGLQGVKGGANWESSFGVFGRVNYNFNDKYLLESNLRRDATSIFPKHMRWKWYPSFSGGWVVSAEDFMKSVEPIMSFAKLRASWGIIGDRSVSNTMYRSILSHSYSNWIENGANGVMFGTPNIVNGDIGWQNIKQLNLGADLRFFKNKLGVSYDWFERTTTDMIVPGEELSVTLGTTSPNGNYGELRTRGWEVAVDFNHSFSNGINVNARVSLSDATSVVTKAADANLPWELRKLSSEWSTGRRYGDIYGYVTDRLYQKGDFVYDANGKIETITVYYNGSPHVTNKRSGANPVYQLIGENGTNVLYSPGDVKFVDVDGDGFITTGDGTNGNPGDQVVIGNSTPRYEYGVRLGADYKGFDFSIFLQGVGKRQIWGDGQLALPGYNVSDGALPATFANDYWTEDNIGAFYPRAWNYNGSVGWSMSKQSRYLLNMAYARIKNITVGYSLPASLSKKASLQKVRVYVSLENFFTFDKLRGLPIDPEAVNDYNPFSDVTGTSAKYSSGRTGVGTPTYKSASVGVQLNF